MEQAEQRRQKVSTVLLYFYCLKAFRDNFVLAVLAGKSLSLY